MPSLNSIINLTISRQTRGVTAAGFGTQLFLGLHKGFTARSRSYSELTEVGEDFATNSNEYRAGTAHFAQNPSGTVFKIGRIDSTTATCTPTVANSTEYTVTINGTEFSFTSDASATAAEIVTGLTSAVNGGSEPVTASGSTTLILTHDTSGDFSLKTSTNLDVTFQGEEDHADALDAVLQADKDWYGLTAYVRTTAAIETIADWVEANKKIYGSSSSTSAALDDEDTDTTSPAQMLKAGAYDRSFYIYHADEGTTNSTILEREFPEVAWMSQMLAYEPGAAQWAYKTLAGITVDDLSTTESTNVLAKNANTYEALGGVNVTLYGKVGSGEWIDIIRDIDWLEARMQERIWSRLANLPKIPYTDNGIAIIESEIRAQLLQGIDKGVIADDTPFTVSVPKSADVSSADRGNRLLPDVEFTARVAGAILKTTIVGVVTA